MQEEQDTCRICSAPAEPDQPLYHPCKCSGTIRYIHQDCLTTWLAHSKKKTCDVCKYPYSFTKVYAPNMPARLPLGLLLRRLAQQFFFAVLFCLRAVMVSTVWLALLPWVTLWTWRMYFMMGDSTAWWISDRPRPPSSYPSVSPDSNATWYFTANFTRFGNDTLAANLYTLVASHPAWRSVSADIFAGQVIACMIVCVFVAGFLLREWIVQNARPGMLDEDAAGAQQADADRVPAEEPPQPEQQAPPMPEPQPEAMPMPEPEPEPAPAPEPARWRERHRRFDLDDESDDDFRPPRQRPSRDYPGWEDDDSPRANHGRGKRPLRGDGVDQGTPALRRRKMVDRGDGRYREVSDDDDTPGESYLGASSPSPPARPFRHPHPERFLGAERNGGPAEASMSSTAFSSRSFVNPEFTFRAPMQMDPAGPFGNNFDERERYMQQRFTDRDIFDPPPTDRSRYSFDDPPPTYGASAGFNFGPPDVETARRMFGNQPQQAPLPYPLAPRTAPLTPPPPRPSFMDPSTTRFMPTYRESDYPPRGPDFTLYRDQRSPSYSPTPSPSFHNPLSSPYGTAGPSTSVYGDLRIPSSSRDPWQFDPPAEPSTSAAARSSMAGAPRRPPLPGISLPPAGAGPSPLHTASSRGQTPLASPSLATYSAPEEFEVGRSSGRRGGARGYFGDDDFPDRVEDVEEEHGHYFRDPDDRPPRFGPDRDIPIFRGRDDEDREREEDAAFRMRAYGRNGAYGTPVDSDEDGLDAEDVRVEMMEMEPGEEADVDVIGEDGRMGQQGGDQGDQAILENQNVDPELLADEVDVEVQDDMDGAMEAIGMRGPIYGVLQNAALMIFILNTTIGIGVWLPFTIGKATALLTLDPRRFLQLLHLPIQAMRLITDPMVDLVILVLKRYIFRPALETSCSVTVFFLRPLLSSVGVLSHEDGTASCLDFLESVWNRIASLGTSTAQKYPSSAAPAAPSLLSRLFEGILHLVEPYFAPLGNCVSASLSDAQTSWTRLAMGHGATERAFAIALGYAVICFIMAIYLNVLSVGSMQSAGRAVRTVVKQQFLVFKMAAFITIELIIFPLGCGSVLDICTIWLFPESSLKTRLGFFRYAPVTATFYHWVIGTMFMYQFAILLAGCRGIMRPGAMWFIKDPQDQNYHPIRDILERPSLMQLRKLCVSAVMYSLVIACGVCTISAVMIVMCPSTLPFRWKTRQPLSDVPVDLLLLHIILPYTMHYFRPTKTIKRLSVQGWKYLAHQLSLTSYMFKDRREDEESEALGWPWINPFASGYKVQSGGLRRVPADDNITLPRDIKATVELDSQGQPVNEEARTLMAMQNREAERAKRNPDDDYTVVWIPNQFKLRIAFFVLSIWFAICVSLALLITIPVQVGRLVFQAFTTQEVHDGYSFMAGFYLLWACYLIGYAADRLDKRRQRRGGDEPRAEWSLYLTKRSILWAAKISYMILLLGFVIPVLISLIVELYIVLPLRLHARPEMIPRIRIVDMWAVGLIYAKIAVRAQRAPQPDNTIMRGVYNIVRNGWIHPDPVRATKEVIGPLIGALLVMLLTPAAMVWAWRCQYRAPVNERFLVLYVYPGIFLTIVLSRLGIIFVNVMSKWSQMVRDKEFLVEMRLQNLDPEAERKKEERRLNRERTSEMKRVAGAQARPQ